MAERRYGPPAQPTTSRVVGEDWYGRDLSGVQYRRVAFVDVDLTEVTDTGGLFEECTFSNVRFNVSVHTDAAFTNCTFTRCSFFDARFERCKLIGSVFDSCAFDITRVTGGNWSFVGLARADLTSATVVGPRMREADLAGLRCHDGTLREVDLSGATLDGADLSGCDLRGSTLVGIDPLTVDLRGAIITLAQAVEVVEGLGLDVRVD
ncbi:pentapeptide repeat-containing protein [Cellulomonas sp. KRMCY2]|uniref:pentapeptide repeat-containing protein n=1 Tax=Cellulomonas sp. KRMCY2 TaxID=1304865 RepID=UPI00045E6070|nr:pentapeptide repeat-containing protein [Cellulomonas sp. KRMCY2]